MTDLKFSILSFLYHSPNRETDTASLFNHFLGSINEVNFAVKEMINHKPPLISKSIGKNTFKLTLYGIETFELEEESRNYQTKQESQKAAEQSANATNIQNQTKKQFRHDFIVAAFSVLLTLFVEHFPKFLKVIVPTIKHFFESLF